MRICCETNAPQARANVNILLTHSALVAFAASTGSHQHGMCEGLFAVPTCDGALYPFLSAHTPVRTPKKQMRVVTTVHAKFAVCLTGTLAGTARLTQLDLCHPLTRCFCSGAAEEGRSNAAFARELQLRIAFAEVQAGVCSKSHIQLECSIVLQAASGQVNSTQRLADITPETVWHQR